MIERIVVTDPVKLRAAISALKSSIGKCPTACKGCQRRKDWRECTGNMPPPGECQWWDESNNGGWVDVMEFKDELDARVSELRSRN
jgi:hypothetical protein